MELLLADIVLKVVDRLLDLEDKPDPELVKARTELRRALVREAAKRPPEEPIVGP